MLLPEVDSRRREVLDFQRTRDELCPIELEGINSDQ
jgi:hypothetical protein